MSVDFQYRNHLYVVMYPVLPDEGRSLILHTWVSSYLPKLPEALQKAVRKDRTHGLLIKIEDVVVHKGALAALTDMLNDYHEHFCLPSPEAPVYGYEYLRIGEAYDDVDYITSPVKVGYLNVKRVAVLDPPWHEVRDEKSA